MNIGNVIRKYRKEAGLTQEEMANRLGVTTPAVNKWENGNSNPDIELLAPIARLLHISLDTLMSFREELTSTEIDGIIRELDSLFDSEGFEKAYGRAVEVIREYPDCNMLIWQIAVVLDARRLTGGCPDSEKYDEQINSWYERALEDESEEIKRHAADSLFCFYLRKKQYGRAREYLKYFSENDPMKKIYQGRLYKEQGENESAYKVFENVIFKEYQILNFAFSFMTTMAVEEGDIQKAHYLAEKTGAIAEVLEMGKYCECLSMLEVACAEKNVVETYHLAEKILENIDSLWDFQKSKLFRHMSFRELESDFTEGLRKQLLKFFREEESFGFMKGYADWEELMAEFCS